MLSAQLDQTRNLTPANNPRTGAAKAQQQQATRPLVGPVPLEGYDAGKLHNESHQSVKYRFGRVASHHGLETVTDKASAEALLTRMRPELEAQGLNIKDIKGDKILVKTELGDEWVDVVRGAGSSNPGWWWGSEGTAVPGSSKLPTPDWRGPVPGEGGTQPPTPSTPGPTPAEPGQPLATVPMKPEYATANIDRSSPAAAAKSAAEWVKSRSPEYFNAGDDRDVAFKMMTDVIGALRAAGYDAHRVVNHPSRPVGDGLRYGSDAVVLNGRIYDVYGAWGDPGRSTPQALDVGPAPAGRPRE